MYSETSNVREEVLEYCKGYGIDLGFGGDKVVPEAIGFESPLQYAKMGEDEADMLGDARYLPFVDETFDYVYSSHLLEDFPNTLEVMEEWTRVLKVGGYLIIYCPVEQAFKQRCKEIGQFYNISHSIDEMDAGYILDVATNLPLEVVKVLPRHSAYSFLTVFRKTSHPRGW